MYFPERFQRVYETSFFRAASSISFTVLMSVLIGDVSTPRFRRSFVRALKHAGALGKDIGQLRLTLGAVLGTAFLALLHETVLLPCVPLPCVPNPLSQFEN